MGLSCINNDRQDLLLPNMYRQGLISQPVFGLYLNTLANNYLNEIITYRLNYFMIWKKGLAEWQHECHHTRGVGLSHFDGPLVWVPVVHD